MEPNVFLGYPTRGIANVLNNFGHEQYSSNSVDPWCLIIKYPHYTLMRILVSLLVLVGLSNIPPLVKRCVMEPIEFLGFLKRGITCLVNPSRHEQYPSNSLNQNNSAHGVTM